MKNKKLILILSICILIFSIGIVNKTFENDTYFTIKTGNYIMQHGVDETEPFTWHENLKFTKLRWGFDVVVASIYNIAGFNGLYVFTVTMAGLIGISVFITLVKLKNNALVSFLMALFVITNLGSSLTCRGQIMSYLAFALEIYSIQKLVQTGNKKYSIYLVLISLMILTFHSSVWLAHFIFYAPYIFEWILTKIKINNVLEDTEKIYLEKRDNKTMKLFFITMLIVLVTGFCTPLKLTPFTYMFRVMGGYSSKIIAELQPLKITRTTELFVTVIGALGILSLTKTKVKLTDICLFAGMLFMARLAHRNKPIAVVILAYPAAQLITTYIKAYNKEKLFEKLDEKLNKSIPALIIALLFTCMLTVTNYSKIYKQPYVNESLYPTKASEFIKENIDLSKARIYNHFNFGSYMELQGIPTFIDSRSEVYCREFSNVDILEDFAKFDINRELTADDMVEKYGITHFVFKTGNSNAIALKNDSKYKFMYSDNNFSVFEVVGNTETVENN